MWVSIKTVLPVVQLEVFKRRRVSRVGDSVSRKALRLCSSETVGLKDLTNICFILFRIIFTLIVYTYISLYFIIYIEL